MDDVDWCDQGAVTFKTRPSGNCLLVPMIPASPTDRDTISPEVRNTWNRRDR